VRFVDAVERAVGQIARSPQSGSLRFSYELEIPGLRVRPLVRFPYLVFYVVGDEVVDVWRILHTRRDIPTVMGDEIGT
jgi:toxin ParE1/3/4